MADVQKAQILSAEATVRCRAKKGPYKLMLVLGERSRLIREMSVLDVSVETKASILSQFDTQCDAMVKVWEKS